MLLSDVVRLNARKAPNRTALVFRSDRHTYGRLRERMDRLANYLGTVAEPGDRVAILAENVPEYVEAYFGVPAAGMTLCMLNQRLHPREWAWILGHSDARVLLVEQQFVDRLEPHLADLPDLRHVLVIGGDDPRRSYDASLAAASDRSMPRAIDPSSPAWLIYTSGTTGFPKGALLTHRGLLAAAMASVMEYGADADERFLMAFPLCHIAGYAVTLNMVRGGAIVLTPSFEPERWMSLVDEYAITASALAPTMVSLVLQSPGIRRHRLASLTKLAYGSAPMPIGVLAEAMDRLGSVLYTGYGMTETSGNALAHPVSAHVRALAGEHHLLRSCGRPVCLADAMIVRDDMTECDVDEVGEIVMRGDQLLAGYHGDDAATAAAFDGGWFHSGDLAKRDEEGFFYIVDRLKDMIVSGGENVYSREVEDAVSAHPAVGEVAVVGVPDPLWGESVTAVVVLRDGHDAGDALATEIVDSCRARLAGYKKPRQVVFRDELPKNALGKVLKRKLRDTLQEAVR